MIRSVLAREDSVYKGFPDIAMTSDGTLVCTYRESLGHSPHPFSRIIVQRSRDGGLNWKKKQTIGVCEDFERDGALSLSCLLSLGDNQLLLISDWVPPKQPQTSPECELVLWRSNDSGQNWSEMEKTGIRGRICPSLNITKSRKIILGCQKFDESSKIWTLQAYISSDLGSSWQGPIKVGSFPKLSLCEGTCVELDNGLIVCYMREEKEGVCAYKAISSDEGKSWEGPYPTHLLSCRGRPKAGLLRSGEVVITYGFGSAPRQLTLHVEMQSTAADPDCVKKTKEGAMLSPTMHRFFIDHDRSIHPDGAYSGWVQFPSGDLYVVNYIVDDAPMAQICSYQIKRSDWMLSPEGRITYTYTASELTGRSHEVGLEVSEDQYRKVRSKGVQDA